MADYTTLFLTDTNPLLTAISTFNQFEKHSGLHLNLTETVIIPTGKLNNRPFPSKRTRSNKTWIILGSGVWYSYNEHAKKHKKNTNN